MFFRSLQRPLEVGADAGFAHLLGHAGAEVGPEPLPLAGQHPVALQVAEGAVVGDDLEAVAERLEAPPGAVAAVGPLTDHRRQQLGPLGAVEDVDPGEDLGLRRTRRLEQAGGEQVLFAAVDVEQLDRGRAVALAAAVEAEPGDPALGALAALLQIGDPLSPPLGRSTRETKLGITRCSSARIMPPYSRASGSGEASSRMISCS